MILKSNSNSFVNCWFDNCYMSHLFPSSTNYSKSWRTGWGMGCSWRTEWGWSGWGLSGCWSLSWSKGI